MIFNVNQIQNPPVDYYYVITKTIEINNITYETKVTKETQHDMCQNIYWFISPNLISKLDNLKMPII